MENPVGILFFYEKLRIVDIWDVYQSAGRSFRLHHNHCSILVNAPLKAAPAPQKISNRAAPIVKNIGT